MKSEFARTQVPYCQVGWDWWYDPNQCLYEWQSLIAGFFALATILAIGCQIRQVNRLHRSDLERRLSASAIHLPTIASALISYSKSTIYKILATQNARLMKDSVDKFTLLHEIKRYQVSYPLDAITALTDLLHNTSKKSEIEFLEKLNLTVSAINFATDDFSLRPNRCLYTHIEIVWMAAFLRNMALRIFEHAQRSDGSDLILNEMHDWNEMSDTVISYINDLSLNKKFIDEWNDFQEQHAKCNASPWTLKLSK